MFFGWLKFLGYECQNQDINKKPWIPTGSRVDGYYIMKTWVSKNTGRATAKRRAAYPGLAWAGILGKTSGQRSVTLQRAWVEELGESQSPYPGLAWAGSG